jgi:hypothetical protein
VSELPQVCRHDDGDLARAIAGNDFAEITDETIRASLRAHGEIRSRNTIGFRVVPVSLPVIGSLLKEMSTWVLRY